MTSYPPLIGPAESITAFWSYSQMGILSRFASFASYFCCSTSWRWPAHTDFWFCLDTPFCQGSGLGSPAYSALQRFCAQSQAAWPLTESSFQFLLCVVAVTAEVIAAWSRSRKSNHSPRQFREWLFPMQDQGHWFRIRIKTRCSAEH